MTDTGQVPGEGLPENAGTVEQPGAPAHGSYPYLSGTTAQDEEQLLLPGAQSPWGNEVAPPVPEPVVETVHQPSHPAGPQQAGLPQQGHEPGAHQPGPHETAGRDSGFVDLNGVRLPDAGQGAASAVPSAASATLPPRRPLHLGPPLPDMSASPVRSLADRGPADAPRQPVPVPAAAPGPEYFDVAGQGVPAWSAQPVASAGGAAVMTGPAAQAQAQVRQAGPVHSEAFQTAGLSPAEAAVARAARGYGVQEAPRADGAATAPPMTPVRTAPPAEQGGHLPGGDTAGPEAAVVETPVGDGGARHSVAVETPGGDGGVESPAAGEPAGAGGETAGGPEVLAGGEQVVPAEAGQSVSAEEVPAVVVEGAPAVHAEGVSAVHVEGSPVVHGGGDEQVVPVAGTEAAPAGETPSGTEAVPGVEVAPPVAVAPVEGGPLAESAVPQDPQAVVPVEGQAAGPVAQAPAEALAPEAPVIAPESVVAEPAPAAPAQAAEGVAPETPAQAAEAVEPETPAQAPEAAPEGVAPAPQAVASEAVPALEAPAEGAPEAVAAPQAMAPREADGQLTTPEAAQAPLDADGPVPAPEAPAPDAEQAPETQAVTPEALPVDANTPGASEAAPAPEAAHPVTGTPADAAAGSTGEAAVEPTDVPATQDGEPQTVPTPQAPQDTQALPADQLAPEAVHAEAVHPEAVHAEAGPPEDPAHQQVPAEAPQTAAPDTADVTHQTEAAAPAEAAGTPAPEAAPPGPAGQEPHPDQPAGQFTRAEGAVPAAPHLAPTPAADAQVAGVPAQAPAGDAPQERPVVPAVPAPRAAEQSPGPESEPAQRADDLDTRAAEQEEAAEPAAESDTGQTPAQVPAQTPAQDEQAGPADEGGPDAAETRQPVGPAAPGYDDAEREAVLKVMRERRDIRNGFRSDPIPHEVLLRVLEAAHTAPSVGHSQPWDFVVIRSADTRRAMHELATRQRDAYANSLPKGRAKQFKELKIEAILDTPVNIVVTADPTRGGRHTLGRHTQPQMAPYSSALAVENLWLAARAEGLGVGWVSFFDEREMVRALGLPEHLEVVAYLCVGYVDEFPAEPELMQAGWAKRRPLSWVVHEETYGRRALPGEEPHDLLAETIAGIRPLDAKALGEAWERQKRMTKPAGALGMLEIISAQLCGLSRQCPPPIPEPAAVAIFAGDHGVHAQGVTPWPQEVTAQMVANFLGGGAVCNAFASQVGAEVCVVDVGVAADLPATPGLLPRKIRAGTADMTAGPALTREEVKQALEVGIETARDLVAAGNKALLTGEMGIANTTASAALISVFTGADPAEVTGRGTGINDETLARKTEVVRRALELHQPDPADPIGVLAAIGGLEHAAMVGLLLGGASLRTPVILDGVSAGAAALVARAIAPEVLAACIAGHRSAEPGHVAALNKLGLRPLVDLDLRLGEGTGALLALPLVQSTARAMHEVATFDSAGVTEK